MKNWSVLAAVMLVVALCPYSAQGIDRKKKEVQPKTTKVVLGKYDELFKNKAHVVAKGGFMTLHKVDGKLFFEMPLKYMGREFLLASTVTSATDNSICVVGYKPRTPRHIKFTLLDSMVCLRNVNSKMTYDKGQAGLEEAMEKNFGDPIVESYRVLAYTPDSSAVVFDMTDMFTKDESSLSPIMPNSGGILSHSASLNKEGSMLTEIKAFEDNVSIKSVLSYLVTTKAMGMLTVKKDDPLTTRVTRTLLLLPENKMRPRITDSRLGIFLGNKVYVSMEEDGIQKYSVANRWRLEPKDMDAWKQGKLVEPVKPIVYYLDNTFPESWKEPLREGILRWNTAFEKIGFKNVVQVRDFPLDDPEFDPDNLKYSCVRYIPSTTANAMGPSWVDPSTGEIINASVLIYNDVIRLINGWRFVQTAQVDPRVRAKKMPDDVVKESLAYVIAHEVGHTLGLMHNMAASAAYPVDSLRSASFTQTYGTTPSIMDYARYNYVAQPGDKGVRLTPPDLGGYDEFVIKWLYTPLPEVEDAMAEVPILEKWLDEKAGDPRYRYGRQQVYARFDPSAIEEDLGDDPVKAGDYGIQNLKYIMSHLNEWLGDDPDGQHRQAMYQAIGNQYYRYLKNVMYNVGGIYLTEVKDGTPGKRFVAVPREVQKNSLKWVIRELKTQNWLTDKELTDKFALGVSLAPTVRYAAAKNVAELYKNVVLSAHVSRDPYTVKEFFDDLYHEVWASTLNNRKLSESEKILQRVIVEVSSEGMEGKKKGLPFLTDEALYLHSGDAFAPSVDEINAYGLDETGMVSRYLDEFREIEQVYGRGFVAAHLENIGNGYGWQRKVTTTAIDDSKVYLQDMLVRVKQLLEGKLSTADKDTKAHYRALILQIEKALKAE